MTSLASATAISSANEVGKQANPNCQPSLAIDYSGCTEKCELCALLEGASV